MAFLQNLIVTGSSKFLNKIYATDIEVSGTFETSGNLSVGGTLNITGNTTLNAVTSTSISNSGSFTNHGGVELIHATPYIDFRFGKSTSDYTSRIIEEANGTITIKPNLKVGALATIPTATITTANITTGNLNSGTAENFNVTNKLHATHFDLQSVAQLGGAFYVSPTIKFPTNSNTTFTITKSGATANIIISDSAITSTTLAGVVWGTNAKIKASGKIGTVTTGTMDGTVTGINTSNHTLTISVSGENSSSITAGTYTSANIDNFCVMMYNTGTYPVGIMMNSYGTDGRTYIDIYGGTSSATEPNVRIGNLGGLIFNGTTLPNQWGIYTNNGYYTGSIVANGGKIGGFTIGSTAIYTGTLTANSDNNIGLSSADFTRTIGGTSRSGLRFAIGDKVGITGDGVLYTHSLQATGGKIGGWAISSADLHNTTSVTTGTASTQYGTFIATGTSNTSKVFLAGSRSYDGTNYGNWNYKFYVRNDGYMYAVSGSIGGWSIETNRLSYGTIGTIDGVYLIPAGSTGNYSIGGSENINNWTITSGANFGVTASGAVYCSDIHATGEIIATSGYIGNTTSGFTIDSSGFYSGTKTGNTSGYITLSNSNFTRTINSTSVSTLRLAIGSKFGVSADGTLYANGANIKNISASNISSGSLSADRISAGSLAIGKLTLDAQETISDAAKTATNYFYYNTTDGLIMSSSASTQTYSGASTGFNTRLTNSALEIRNGTTVLASYGDTIIIGENGGSQQVIDNNSLNFNTPSGETKFTIKNEVIGHGFSQQKYIDLFDEDDYDNPPAYSNTDWTLNNTKLANIIGNLVDRYQMTSSPLDYAIGATTSNCTMVMEVFGYALDSAGNNTPQYSLSENITFSIVSLTNGQLTVKASESTSSDWTDFVTEFASLFPSGSNHHKLWANFTLNYPIADVQMTLGSRNPESTIGTRSVSIGSNNTASGTGSIAIGKDLVVTDDYSVAIGQLNLPLESANTGEHLPTAFAIGANGTTPFAVLKNGLIIMSQVNSGASPHLSYGKGSKTNVRIDFDVEYPNTPFIFLTLREDDIPTSAISDYAKVQVFLQQVDTTGFTATVINGGDHTHSFSFNWFAICLN